MNKVLSIRPSKDIRTNYPKISELAKKNPVAITVNGKEDTVLMSHEEYQSQMNYISDLEVRLSFYEHLSEAEDDVRLGRVQSAEEVFQSLQKEVEKF